VACFFANLKFLEGAITLDKRALTLFPPGFLLSTEEERFCSLLLSCSPAGKKEEE